MARVRQTLASRFIYREEFVCDGRVEKEAFMPSGNIRPYETSIILHNSSSDIDWRVGNEIGRKRTRPISLVGSAEFNDIDATLSELLIVPEPSSISPNHANLKGWDELDKLHRIAQAEMIATRSVFTCPPV